MEYGSGLPPYPSRKPSLRTLAASLLLFLITLNANAADFRPFTAASKATIERAHVGSPFVLAFWSLECTYCAEELQLLNQLIQKHPTISLVLVNTDPADSSAEAGAMLDKLFIGKKLERWIFATEDAEHLYFAVDKKWHGELPRAYFYDSTGTAKTVAGKVESQWLKNWGKDMP